MDSATMATGFWSSKNLIINSSSRRNFTPMPQLPSRIIRRSRRYSSTSTIYALLSETSAAISEPATVDITWQIVVGTLAGITPFTVAGIEFSKRIIKQRQCGVCNGSGLVLADKNFVKCPACGGWLPWQSWKRFFTG